jgi:hypothetical protein
VISVVNNFLTDSLNDIRSRNLANEKDLKSVTQDNRNNLLGDFNLKEKEI